MPSDTYLNTQGVGREATETNLSGELGVTGSANGSDRVGEALEDDADPVGPICEAKHRAPIAFLQPCMNSNAHDENISIASA